MPTSPVNSVIQNLLAEPRPIGGDATDGEFLARFVGSRDATALAALVRRHAPMVWGVCRRVLANFHDAEDAFQATFLVLVRKAAEVPAQAVAAWLYGVPRQTAVRLRATAAKQHRRETQVATMPEPTVAEVRDDDLPAVLDEELGLLPEHYRGVVVLCDLEGLTRRDAARQLGIPEGSVASRLARARAMLAKRLARRGFVLPGGSAAAVLAAGASASAPPALVASTIDAASLVAVGTAAAGGVIAARVAALTEGMVKAMFVTRIKGVLAVVLVAGLALAAAAGLLYQAQAAEEPKGKGEPPTLAKDHGQAAEEPTAKGGGSPIPAKDRNMSDEKPARAVPPAETDEELFLGGWIIVNDDSKRKGEPWHVNKDKLYMHANVGGFYGGHFYRLDAGKTPKQIDIFHRQGGDPKGAAVQVIKAIYVLDTNELRLCLGEVDKDRPAAFPEKPKPGDVLILHRTPPRTPPTKAERLKTLLDKVLAAHGGEDKLTKLTSFTMTVKHSNGETQHYFVQPPKNFRWETTHRDRTGKRIVILFPEGRRWWSKEPGEDAKEFHLTGIEPKLEYWHDYVKFFGPRQVLRLKDADHKVVLLDEEAKVGDRAAVGVTVTGPHYDHKMYFDKETHLLLEGFGDSMRKGTYSDYKTFDGIPIALKEKDGYFEPEVTDFKVVEKFDVELFEQP